MSYLVSTFYALKALDEAEQQSMLHELQHWPSGEPPLKGMVLVAPDGLNATVAAGEDTVKALESWLGQRLPLSAIKRSRSPVAPFRRWKVVRRRETVTSGVVGGQTGDAGRLSPREWHEKMLSGGVTLIDVRNDYEIRLGTFTGALDPGTANFSQFADFVTQLAVPKDQPILTFCTGGIRCEKAAPYLAAQGYTQVFQLDGGILNYLEHYPEGFFEGECFVFDERVALDTHLRPTTRYLRCPRCGQPGPPDFDCCA